MNKMMAIALLTSLAAPAVADEVQTGARVRLTAPGIGTLVGALVASDAEALTVRTGKGDLLRVPRADVRRLEVSRRPGRRGRGALIGLAAGAVGGYIWGAASNPDPCPRDEFCFIFDEPLFSDEASGAMGAILFGGVGALAGVIVAPGERWSPVSGPRVGLKVTPVRRGAAVALSLRF